MKPYVIVTDSACDIPLKTLNEWGVKAAELTFSFENDKKQYRNYELSANEFYERMINGDRPKTSAVNVSTFKDMFKKELKSGNDILYIGFSSGLSATYSSALVAAEELLRKYPDSNILTVDSLGASAGMGLLVKLAVDAKAEGKTLEETAEYIKDMRLNICHWFTVDDLVYLKRGGRISPQAAVVGNLIGIKPLLHVDNEGHLINVAKIRGRRNSISNLAKKFEELAVENSPVFISHGNCPDDAAYLASLLREKYGVETKLTVDVGPVIGAHSGPGTLAVFFITDKIR